MTDASSSSTDTSSLPTGTTDVLRFARDHPVVFEEIHEAVASRAKEADAKRKSPMYVQVLLERYESLQQREDFSPGDLVVWKPGLRNKVRPDYAEPSVVLEVLNSPILNQKRSPGSAYYREPLNLVLGLLDEDQELIQFYFDARRFQKVQLDAH